MKGELHQRKNVAKGDGSPSVASPSKTADPTHQATAGEHEQGKRMQSFKVRLIFTIMMIGGFIFLIYLGPLPLSMLVILIQVVMFNEILALGLVKARDKEIPLFRSIQFYFLFTAMFYLYGRQVLHVFEDQIYDTWLWNVEIHHAFLSFCFYVFGFVLFVVSLRKGLYRYQFNIFCWTHMTLLLVPLQASAIISNISQGLIWFIGPCSLIICNDCWAYMFGFFFGRTPLIKLSPKKTWEGFIGGGLVTVLFGFFVADWICQFDWMICPQPDILHPVNSCVHAETFVYREFFLPQELTHFLQSFGIPLSSLWLRPLQLHAVVFALFASIIGPFGGFFASGFKRAFKIKDFGDSIPGHGGLTDRMDCQLLMGVFAFVYYNSFIRSRTPQLMPVYSRVMHMTPSDQVALFHKLKDSLVARKLIQA